MGIFRVLAGILILVLASVAYADTEEKNILVVHSYHLGMPWADAVTQGLVEGMKGKAQLVITQLDIKRFPEPGRETSMEETVSSKARASKAALVVAVDDYAYRFCVERRDRLFPGKPIVFCGVNFWDRKNVPGVTGIVENIDIITTLRLARSLQPNAKRLVVVNDSTETGQANHAALDQALKGLTDLEVLQIGEGTFEDTETTLATLRSPDDIVLLLSWNRDSLGRTRSYEEAAKRARSICQAPLYSVWEFYFGEGIVGGSLLDGTVHGRETASLASLVLSGVPIDEVPIVTQCKRRLVVDDRELRRFGFNLDSAPSGIELAFREYSLWREHRVLISSVFVVLVAQGVTIVFLARSRIRRRRVEASLRRSEENLAVTLSSIGDAVIATDTKGMITLMNPVAERLTGWFAAEAQGLHYSAVTLIVHSDGSSPACNPIAEVIHTGNPVSNRFPHLMRNRTGDERLVMENAAPIRSPGGELLGVVMVVKDVTEERKLEDQLRHSQKMESIGLLAGGVAHDFNNILQVVIMNMQLARMPDTPPSQREELLQHVEDAASRATDLTRQLLAFGRRQRLDMRPVDLSLLVAGMLKMVRRVLGSSIEVSFAPAPELYWVRADKGQIEQVLLNLCLNARDAMPKGGQLIFELARVSFSDQDALETPWLRVGNFVKLSVSDTGCGMDRETLSRIFEPFFTTKASVRGTGLGLSVVQGVVQQHQGMINAYSEPGNGTTFRIYLPEIQKPDSVAETAKPAPVEIRRDLRILLAEDDPLVRESTCMLLQRCGHQVDPVCDGQEACDALDAGHVYDLVLMDVVMPRVGGLEAAAYLHQKAPGIPIVLCSGFSSKMVTLDKVSFPYRFLAKPYSKVELLRIIADIVPPSQRTS